MKILPNIKRPQIGFRYRVNIDWINYDWQIIGIDGDKWILKSLSGYGNNTANILGLEKSYQNKAIEILR